MAAQIQPCERVCCGWRRPAGRGAAEAAAGGSGRSVGTRRGFTAHAPTASRLTYPAPSPPPPALSVVERRRESAAELQRKWSALEKLEETEYLQGLGEKKTTVTYRSAV